MPVANNAGPNRHEVLSYFLRILLPLGLFSLAAITLYFVVDTWYEKKLIQGEQAQQVELSLHSLRRDVSGVIRELRLVAASDNLKRFIASPGTAERRAVETELATFAGSMQRYDQVRWLDLQGREQLRIDHRDGVTHIVPRRELQDKSTRYYFTEAITLPPGAIYISPLDLNVEHGMLELPHRPMLRFAMPTADAQGKRNGLLIFNYQASLLLDNFSRSKQDEQALLSLLNAEGYWLFSSTHQDEWGFMFGLDERFQNRNPEVWAAIRQQGAGVLVNAEGMFTFATVDTDLLLDKNAPGLLPAKGKQVVRPGDIYWVIVSHYPRSALSDLYIEHIGLYGILFLLIVLLLGFISWKLARSQWEHKNLTERLALHAKVMESSTNGVVITDTDSHIVAINKGFTDLTGYTRDEVLGQTPAIIASGRHDEDYYRGMWQELVQKDYWEGEIWNRHKNGELFPEWLAISAIRNSEGVRTHYIGIFSLLSEHLSTAARLRELASSDPLTGLINRNLLYDRAGQALAHSHRTGSKTAFLFLDLDGFKPINDTLGHAAGDSVLKTTAKRLKVCVRESDTVARFGGDEFMVLLPELKSVDEAEAIAEKIRAAVAQPITINGKDCRIGVSIGISLYPDDGMSVEDLITYADQAMYRAKESGKGKSTRYQHG